MDPLSDVLRAVRLTGAYFYLSAGRDPWSVYASPARDLVPHVLPEAQHLISYHVLVTGSCWGAVDGEDPVHLSPGDVIMFPHGDAYRMASKNGGSLTPSPYTTAPRRYPETAYLGPDGERETTFVCGFLGCDVRPFNPLLASLPRLIHCPGAASGWLSEFPKRAVAESRTTTAGSETMLTRMAELMFIDVIRHHIESLPEQNSGWLAGLRDAVVGPALTCLHSRPAHPWTLAELAREISTSRTVLASRFSSLVGVSPMTYLTRWRLQLASEQLARGSAKVAAIGAQVGYDSEAAFSRAFKRETGVSPAAWRRARPT